MSSEEATNETQPDVGETSPTSPVAAPSTEKATAAVSAGLGHQESGSAPQGGVAKRAQKTRRINLQPPLPANSVPKKAPAKPEEKEQSGDSDYLESDGESEEPSQALAAIAGAFQQLGHLLLHGFQCVLRLVRRGLCGLVCALRNVFSVSVNTGLFFLVLYLTATYLVSPATAKDVRDFPSKMRYLARGHALILFPVVLGYVVSRWKRTEVQRRFADEVFRLCALLALNQAVFATYAKDEDFHWARTLSITTAAFSMLYWISLSYGRGFMKKALSQPPLVAIMILMMRNFVTIIIQDLGYVEEENTAEVAPPREEATYWDYVTMCHMVERVFCSVDGQVPLTLHQ